MKLATSLLVAGLLVASPVACQNVNMEHPAEVSVQHRPSPEEMRERLRVSEVQNDAKELAELCASVTTDMDSIKEGLLPKDAAERLKRMEKLSKRMRDSLTKASTQH
jgi:hypothetical protein